MTDNSEREVRAFRLLRMIYYLYNGNYTTRQLSRLLGVSVRTVQRDLLALQDSDLGFPIVNKTQCVWGFMSNMDLEEDAENTSDIDA